MVWLRDNGGFLIRILKELGKTSRNVEIGFGIWGKVDKWIYGIMMNIIV